MSPFPGVFAEGCHARRTSRSNRPAQAPTSLAEERAPADEDVFKVKFAQVCDDQEWDIAEVMAPFGISSKFSSPTILKFEHRGQKQRSSR